MFRDCFRDLSHAGQINTTKSLTQTQRANSCHIFITLFDKKLLEMKEVYSFPIYWKIIVTGLSKTWGKKKTSLEAHCSAEILNCPFIPSRLLLR